MENLAPAGGEHHALHGVAAVRGRTDEAAFAARAASARSCRSAARQVRALHRQRRLAAATVRQHDYKPVAKGDLADDIDLDRPTCGVAFQIGVRSLRALHPHPPGTIRARAGYARWSSC
jgi:hypothetical protein